MVWLQSMPSIHSYTHYIYDLASMICFVFISTQCRYDLASIVCFGFTALPIYMNLIGWYIFILISAHHQSYALASMFNVSAFIQCRYDLASTLCFYFISVQSRYDLTSILVLYSFLQLEIWLWHR